MSQPEVETPLDERPGQRVGPYVIEGLIGRGGMGVVLRARDPEGKLVAVKAIRPDLVTSTSRARFAREGALRIEHPNVIRTLAHGTDEVTGKPWIAFELLEGESLEQRLARVRRLTTGELVPILRAICAGLGAAHAQGVVHRDLKPANVFLCRDGQVKVLDFGIALEPSQARITGDLQLLGTIAYLSVEQARGARDVDARSDVWAVGALAYEAISGQLPFEREAALVTLLAIIQDAAPSLDEVVPGTPGALARLVTKCLQKRRQDRFQDVEELDRALSAIELRGTADTQIAGLPALERPRRATLTTDESRVVVLVLARETFEPDDVEAEIVQHGGIAIPLLGGDVLGVFGATAWRGDEVQRAAAAAIRIRHLAARVGMSSGRAHAGGTGIAGDAIVGASRAAEAEIDGVAVANATARVLGDRFLVSPVDDEHSELFGEREEAEVDEAERDPSPIIGRESDLARIDDMLELWRFGAAALVFTGEAGIGKSRLRREAEQRARAVSPEAVVLAARGESMRGETAFGLFASALRRRAREGALAGRWPMLRPDAPPLTQRQAVLALVRDAIPERDQAARCADFIGVLLGVQFPPNPALLAARRDPQLLADRLRGALVELLAAQLERGPLILSLDDVQWADVASIAVVNDLLRASPLSRLLVLATERSSDSVASVFPPGAAIVFRVGGLDLSQMGALASRVAGQPLPEALVAALAERTEGNPLFIEQIVSVLKEGAAMEGTERLPLPFTVEAAIQARLDDLDVEDRDAAKAASLYGRPVSAADLGALDVREPAARMAALCRCEILEAQLGGRLTGGLEHRFRSALMASVAYRTIPQEARASMHAKAARHLDTETRRDAEEIALHYERAGEQELASERFAEAAIESAARGDADRALRCSARAIAFGLPAGLAFDVHMARADTLRFLRKRREQAEELALAFTRATTPLELARVYTEQASIAGRSGRFADATALAAAAGAHADASGDVEVRAAARFAFAEAATLAHDLVLAEHLLEDATLVAETCGPGTRARAFDARALIAAQRGDLGGAVRGYAEAVRLHLEAGDLRRAAALQGNLADQYNRIGEHEEAERRLRDALDACRRVGNRVYEGYAMANLGYALAQMGRGEEALAILDASAAAARETDDARLAIAVRAYRARALGAAGRAPEAVVAALEAAAQARSIGNQELAASAHALVALLSLDDDLELALSHSAEALELRDELGGIAEDEAEVFLARAEALAKADLIEEADAVRDRGIARLRELAGAIADPAWRERFLRGPAAHRRLIGAA